MPQKSRSQKERAAAKRESGQYKAPVAPAPIETEAPNADSGLTLNVPSAPTRRSANAAALAHNAEPHFDYSYVYADLRRIALLAILCFGIMIAAAFYFNR
ncbi:MAG: hypothetical protein EYC68_17150 [Chloroflexota bacterium]|nr:MAG: hypothetical protein EYC68_17150 [Chloroflexota bacterium]